MPTHKRVRCTIHTENGPLHEYRDNSQSSSLSTQTVYIQAEDRANFWIVCEALPDYKYTIGDRITFHLYVDGKVTGTQTIGPSYPRKEHRGALFDGFSELFQFAEISSSTPLPAENHDAPYYDLPLRIGEISVDVMRSKYLEHYKWFGMRPARNPSKDEKALNGKGLTHITRRGLPAVQMPKAGWTVCRTESIDTAVNPFARFRFLYRSKGALQKLGLVPRTPSPLRLTRAGTSDTELSIMEVTGEIPRFGAKLNSLKGKEKEEEDHPGVESPRIKRRRLSGRARDQVIDLTGDD